VLLETVTPLTLAITLTVQQELQTRLDETDRLHRRAVERARYEADLARRQYLHVDPANRLVADELEAHWNHALQQVADAQETHERQRQADRVAVDADARARILALATDYGAPPIDRNDLPRTRGSCAGKSRASSADSRADAHGEAPTAPYEGPALLDCPCRRMAGVAHRLDRRASRQRAAVAPPVAPSRPPKA
jgi:hypothetical protein